jgi:uncharacterized protein YkwD
MAVPSRPSRQGRHSYGRHAAPPERAVGRDGRSRPGRTPRRSRRAAPVAAFLAVLVVAAGGAWALGARGEPGRPDASREAGLLTDDRQGAELAPDRTEGTDPASRDKRAAPAAPSLRPLEPTSPAADGSDVTTRRSTAPAPAPTRPTSRPPVSRPAPAPAPTGSTTAAGATAIEAEVTRLTNAERAKAGCGALRIDARLTAAARGHSADMVDRDYFSHTSPDGRGPGDRAEAAGYPRWSGENIAAGYSTAAAVVQGWMNSEGHRANILNCSSTATGVGYDARGNMWTQMFGFE